MKIQEYVNEAMNLNEEYLVEMARIGWIPIGSTKGAEVYVRTDDSGKVPHFHIRKYGKNNKFEWETCVKFEEAEYFLHGKYKDRLSSHLKHALNDMLKENNPKDPGRTYWQTAVNAWNMNNSDIELDVDIKQPDYTKLK